MSEDWAWPAEIDPRRGSLGAVLRNPTATHLYPSTTSKTRQRGATIHKPRFTAADTGAWSLSTSAPHDQHPDYELDVEEPAGNFVSKSLFISPKGHICIYLAAKDESICPKQLSRTPLASAKTFRFPLGLPRGLDL